MKCEIKTVNHYDVLKAVAAVLMLVDHLGYFFWIEAIWLRVLGRCSFPIYAILHGITYRRFHVELLYYCLGFEIIIFFILGTTSLSIISNFCLSGLLFPYAYILWQKYPWAWLGLAPLLIYYTGWLDLHMEYGVFVLLFMLVGKIIREEQKHYLKRLLVTIIAVGFILNQTHGFMFTQLQMLSISIELVGIISGIYWLPLWKTVTVTSAGLQRSILVLSRYSLQFYCIHYIIFALIWYWQYLMWSATAMG